MGGGNGVELEQGKVVPLVGRLKPYVLCMVGKWITLGVVLLTYNVDIELNSFYS